MFQSPAVATDFCKRFKQVLGPAQRPTPQVLEVKGTRHETNMYRFHSPHIFMLGYFISTWETFCTFYVDIVDIM